MKKKYLTVFAGIFLMCCTACGNEEVKIVNKLPNSNTNQESKQEQENGNKDLEVQLTGFVFKAEADGKEVPIGVDIEAASIVEALGEASGYFESTSCAFDGIDKMYTYDHFRIETYPDGEKDRISYIFFLDDMAETAEGVCIGMSMEQVKAAYGSEYEDRDGLMVYTKDGMHLSFLIRDEVVASIEYSSGVMDTQE